MATPANNGPTVRIDHDTLAASRAIAANGLVTENPGPGNILDVTTYSGVFTIALGIDSRLFVPFEIAGTLTVLGTLTIS